MFKALIRSITLFFLLFVNMALFTWCVNQFLDQAQPKKTLISPVQAKVTPLTPKSRILREPITQRSLINELKHTTPTQPDKHANQLLLQFQSLNIHLSKAERVKLENKLQHLKITRFHSAKIFIGAALAQNNIPSPQTAKLRAQNIARLIYHYTQSVKMFYRPSMKDGAVIVEFVEPSNAG